MKITMESTCEIVSVHGVPCRTWAIETIDGVKPEMESFVYTRMLAIDPDIVVDDPNVYLLDGANPPSADEVQIYKEID
jgi:hypothetical protein